MPAFLPAIPTIIAAATGLTAEEVIGLGLALFTTGAVVTKTTIDRQKKHGHQPGPDEKPEYPIPLLPLSRDDEQKNCQMEMKDRYDHDKAGAPSRYALRFDRLTETDKQVVLKHLCETQAGDDFKKSASGIKADMNNLTVNLDDLWSDPRMVQMLHTLHDQPSSKTR